MSTKELLQELDRARRKTAELALKINEEPADAAARVRACPTRSPNLEYTEVVGDSIVR